jgi:hypothetical protein
MITLSRSKIQMNTRHFLRVVSIELGRTHFENIYGVEYKALI